MDNILAYLQNLKPNGTSNIPQSKLDRADLGNDTVDECDAEDELKESDLKMRTMAVANTKEGDNTKSVPGQSQKKDVAVKQEVVGSTKKEEVPGNKERNLVKQVDIRQESSEFEDIDIPLDRPINNQSEIPTIEVKSPQATSPPPAQQQTIPVPLKPEVDDVPEEDDYEKIKKVWKELSIGKDGYLTSSELEKFCFHIGMNELDKEDLEKLFITIDTDKDGRVSFAEFCDGLQNQGRFIEQRIQPRVARKKSAANQRPTDRYHSPIKKQAQLMYFSSIDPHRNRYIDSSKVIDFWAAGGIVNGKDVLEYLDFDLRKKLDLFELSQVLDEEIDKNEYDAITLAIIVTFKKEIEYQRSMLEIMQDAYNRSIEPKNMKKNNRETNPSYIQEMQSAMIARNEMTKAALNKQTYQYENMMTDKMQLDNQVVTLNNVILQLEEENGILQARITELEKVSARQEEELDAVAELHRKMELELKILRDTKIAYHQNLSQQDREQLEQLKSKFEEEIDKATKTNTEVKQKLTNKKHDDLESEIIGLKKKIEILEDELDERQRSNHEIKRTSEKLAATMDSQMKLHNSSSAPENELRMRLDEMCRENQILLSEITTWKENNDKIDFENKEISRENEELDYKLKQLQRKLDVIKNREEALQERLNNVDDIHGNSKQLGANLASIKALLEEKNIQLERSHGKLQELQLDNEEKTRKLEKIQKKNEDLNKEIENLNNKLRKHQETDTRHTGAFVPNKYRESKEDKTDNSDLLKELENSQSELKAKSVIIQKLEDANDHLSGSLREAVDKFERATATMDPDQYNKELMTENIKLTKLNYKLDEEINKLHRRIGQLQSEEVKDTNYEIQNLQKKLSLKDKQIRKLEDNLRFNENNQMKNTEKYHTLKQIDQLQFQLEELNKKYKVQLEQVEKSDNLLQEIYNENAKLLKSLQRSEDYREQSEIKIATLEEKIRTLQSVIDRISR